MTLADCFSAATQSLRLNLLRSVLTTLGIVIGVAAVISMVSVGAGAQAQVNKLIQSIGSNLLLLLPGSSTQGGVHFGFGSQPTLTEDDAEAIKAEIADVVVAAPAVRGNSQVIYGNANWFTAVQGVTADYFVAREWEVETGRAFTDDEISGGGKVVLLGATVVGKLFSDRAPVGETVRINRVPFEVIGVLGVKGQTPLGQDQDDTVLVPLKTAKQRVLGGRWLGGRTVGTISVKVATPEAVGLTERRVTELLRDRHRIRPGTPDDFQIRNIADLLTARAQSSRVMTILLAAVASVSLVVGGIGIMNIMLVSVTERTREIGLRMAVGAAPRDILAQFLVEAVTLSLVGGAIGVALGIAGSQVASAAGDWPLRLEPGAVLLAFGFSAAIGIFFGWYPARKAAQLDPIEALRRE
ncbi:MAG: FtsX-like permease family protein [Alphaproteobacteria bacterium]|nr:FtsX-like permease family protein [Alphaproteobacteria bacterium]